jgi:hypothetical protein
MASSFQTVSKKGKSERRQQGLYNGILPFGVVKGENGIPVPDRHDLVFIPDRY